VIYRDRSNKSSIFIRLRRSKLYLADAAERSIRYLLLQLDSTIKVSQLHSTIGDFHAEATAYLLKPNVAYATAPVHGVKNWKSIVVSYVQ
jgi:hypothetical protein